MKGTFLLAAAPASLVTADTATIDAPLSLPAQLYVEHDAVVFARSAGVVESIFVDLGSRAAAGLRSTHSVQ